jgi:DNA mismatch repair protein MutS2
MDPVSLEKLDFAAIRRLLAGFSRSALGRRLAERIEPSTDIEEVRRRLDQTEQMRTAIAANGIPPMGGVTDIGNLVRHTKDASRLEPGELAQVAATLAATGALRTWLSQLAEESAERYALLLALGERIGDLSPVAAQILAAIDERGGVRDSASVKLSSIRAQIARAAEDVKLVVQRMLRVHSVQKMLQYPSATFHNDRYVLPVKAEYNGRIDGIVHRASDTGATIYVEPAEAVN